MNASSFCLSTWKPPERIELIAGRPDRRLLPRVAIAPELRPARLREPFLGLRWYQNVSVKPELPYPVISRFVDHSPAGPAAAFPPGSRPGLPLQLPDRIEPTVG